MHATLTELNSEGTYTPAYIKKKNLRHAPGQDFYVFSDDEQETQLPAFITKLAN